MTSSGRREERLHLHGGAPKPRLKSRLGCDNQGTIAFAKNPTISSRIKHVARDFLKIREWIADKFFRMEYVSSKNNPADLLTKYLCPSSFLKLRSKLMTRARSPA